jgi:HPt (histidine-containing phosphotransfer) domain-containing protein
MTVQECYEQMNGDYKDVAGRLMSDTRIEKYLRKFLDTKDYQELLDALEREDYETAFRAVHTLKGLSMNLGFSDLKKSSEELCESLRGGKPHTDISKMVEAVKSDYQNVISAIQQL